LDYRSSLFTPVTQINVTNNICASVVAWLNPGSSESDLDHLIESFLKFKEFYRIRSDIVHGRIASGPLSDSARALLQILSACLGIALGLGVKELDGDTLFQRFANVAGTKLRERKINIYPR